MTNQEIIEYIDDGAVFYLDFFGDAEHMETTDNGFYRIIRPKDGEQGIKFIYDLRLEALSDEEAQAKIVEMKALSLPVWWPLHSKKVQQLLQGKDYVPQSPAKGDEFYMALPKESLRLLPENKPDRVVNDVKVKRIENAADFKLWANMTNQIFTGGYQDIHPVNHYYWCEKGRLSPYIAYCNDTPAAVAAIMNNNGIASLEFVATLEEYRRKGMARAVCITAIRDAFADGAKIITTRAFYPANQLYQSLRFQIYY